MPIVLFFLFLLPTLATAATQTAESKPVDINSHTVAIHAVLKLHENYYTPDGKRRIEEPKPEAQKPPTPPPQLTNQDYAADDCRIL